MPRAIKIRIINANYNDHSRRISDLTFDVDTDATLIRANNGIGKTVVDQYACSPFTDGKKRNRDHRDWEEYITDKNPTTVAYEFRMDNGMVFIVGISAVKERKKEDAANENDLQDMDRSPIRIIGFIGEYYENCPYTLDKIRFTQQQEYGKHKRPVSMSKLEHLFADFEAQSGGRFRFYNMKNNHKAYYSRLASYGISRSTWETITVPLNMSEDAITEKFAKENVTTQALAKNWVIPCAERIINSRTDKNRVREIIKTVIDYIDNYESYREQLKRNTVWSRLAKEIEKDGIIALDRWKKAEEEHLQTDAVLVSFASKVTESRIKTEKEIEQIKEDQQKLKEEQAYTRYGQASYEYYCLKQNREEEEQKADRISDHIERCEQAKEGEERELKIIDAAETASDISELEKDCLRCTEEIEKEKLAEGEIQEEREKTGALLYVLNEERVKQIREGRSIKEQQEQEAAAELEEIENRLREEQKEQTACQDEITRHGRTITAYGEKERVYTEEFNSTLMRNPLTQLYEEHSLEDERTTVTDLIGQSTKDLKATQKAAADMRKQKTLLDEQEEAEIRKVERQKAALETEKARFENYQKQIEERKDMLKCLRLEPDRLYDTELIEASFHQELDQQAARVHSETQRLEEAEEKEEELQQCLNGTPLSVPNELLQDLREYGVYAESGHQFLLSDSCTDTQKQNYLESHPELPYAIIINRSEVDAFRRFKGKQCLKYAIPVILRDELDQPDSSVLMYTSFDTRLLDPKHLEQMLAEVKEAIPHLKQKVSLAREEQGKWQRMYDSFKRQTITEEIVSAQADTVTRCRMEIDEREANIEKLKTDICATAEKIDELTEREQEQKQNLIKAEARHTRLEYLINEYKSASDAVIKRNDACRKEQDLRRAIENDREEKEVAGKIKDEIHHQLMELDRKLHDAEKECSRYDDYKNVKIDHSPLEEERNGLEARMLILSKSRAVDLDEMRNHLSEKEAKLKKKQAALQELLSVLMISAPELEVVNTSTRRRNDLNKSIGAYDAEIRKFRKQFEYAKERAAKITGKLEEKQVQIAKVNNGSGEPLAEEIAMTVMWKDNMDNLIRRMEETDQIRREKEKRLNKLSVIEDSLDNLDLETEAEAVFEEEIDSFDDHELDEIKGSLCRKRKETIQILEQAKEYAKDKFKTILSLDIYRELPSFSESSRRIMNSLERGCDQALTNCNNYIKNIRDLIEASEATVAMDTKERRKIVSECMDLLHDLHAQIERMDRKSTIEVAGVKRKMFQIRQQTWEDHEDTYAVKMAEKLASIIENVANIEEKGKKENYISSSLAPYNLYDDIIGINTISIKAYKVQEDGTLQLKKWEDVIKLSGGEGTLTGFIAIANFIAYLNESEDDFLSAHKNDWFTLILDNPFAKMQSKHLVGPFMDIAKTAHIQLIIFSSSKEADVMNAFDHIYNISYSKLPSGIEQVYSVEKKIRREEVEEVNKAEVREYKQLAFPVA